MSKVDKINFDGFEWISLTHPTEAEINKLRDYGFHPLDLEDCLTPAKRNKIDSYDNYIFSIMLWPKFNPKTREISSAEIDFFLGKDFLITLHHNDLKPFSDAFELYRLSGDMRSKHKGETPEKIVYDLFNKLYLYIFPMVDHLIVDCDEIEKAIFTGKEKKMVSEIMIIRRNIIDFRKIMQAHKNVLKRLIFTLKENPIYKIKKTDVYFEGLTDYTKEIWDQLDNLKERIEALQQTNESRISYKLSDIMRILTIISVITFPVTLMAAIFGMNTIESMPFVNNPFGFWIIVGLMLALIFGMLTTFKKKGWL